MRKRTIQTEPSCLYPPEDEIARAVVGPERAKAWDGIATVLERRGFPKKDPTFGGRYWPAVKAYLDRRHGLNQADTVTNADGEENWDAKPGSRAVRPRP